METKQAVLPLSAPVSTSILLCFGNRHNHITVFDETVFVSSMTLHLQAVQLFIQTLLLQAMALYIHGPLRCKDLLGRIPNPHSCHALAAPHPASAPADTIQHTQQPHPDRPQISQPEPPRPHRRASEASHSIRHTARHFFKSKAQIRHIPAVSRPL